MFNFKISIIKRAFTLLPNTDKLKFILIVIIQILLGALDLIGVALIGILGALSVTGIQASNPGNRVSYFLNLFNLQEMALQQQVSLIGFSAAFFMVAKTTLSMFFTKKSLVFLGVRSGQLSGELVQMITSQEYSKFKGKSKQEIIFSLTSGANSLILGVLGSFMTILSDCALIIVMLFGLFFIEPRIALGSLIFFALIGFFLNKNLSKKAQYFGLENMKYSIRVNELISNLLDTYRELFVRNEIISHSKEIEKTRIKIAEINSGMAFLPYVSKYVLETSVVIGALLLAMYQFSNQDAARAVGNIALFLAAGTRIVPSILRLQQGLFQIKSSSGGALPTLKIYDELNFHFLSGTRKTELRVVNSKNFNAEVLISNVSYKYPSAPENVLKDVSFEIANGSLVALVGKSGAGKSTLADLILGVLDANQGSILVSGLKPIDAVKNWPGAISYVPQDISIISGTIIQNITLDAMSSDTSDVDKMWSVLKMSQLDQFINKLPDGLMTVVGEKGAKLSGGQRQRLGIARALYTDPKLIILDEATSALDSETENDINLAIQNLRGSVTLIIIAHRLATVRNADKVCYFNNGLLEAVGSFDEVRLKIPDFDYQAKLLGL
jgi:ABC-type multidrug transport system fused ATPase/permease subunit